MTIFLNHRSLDYQKYYDNKQGINIIISLLSEMDHDLLPDNVRKIYTQIISHKDNTINNLRIFYRCVKYIIRCITITNFDEYFPLTIMN